MYKLVRERERERERKYQFSSTLRGKKRDKQNKKGGIKWKVSEHLALTYYNKRPYN